MPSTFGVVDLFAGPGGLGEGFAALVDGDHYPFQIGISVEREASAHRTLRLRAFLREYRRLHNRLPQAFVDFHAGICTEPDWAKVDGDAWRIAVNEAHCLELGAPKTANKIEAAIFQLQRQYNDNTVLIGGPPCQAYSLVGRARAKGKQNYVPEEDGRHYLFREYIRVLDRLRPAAFVMENVKGMLSSTVESRLVFDMLMDDLSSLGDRKKRLYELRAITIEDGVITLREVKNPSDFVVRAEELGVPQRRHRVILIGLRSDKAQLAGDVSIQVPAKARRTVDEAIANLPPIRSGLSNGDDTAERWQSVVRNAALDLGRLHRRAGSAELKDMFNDVARKLRGQSAPYERSAKKLPKDYGRSNDSLRRWLENGQLIALAQHEARGHMESDLGRYLFAAVYGKIMNVSPKADEFPQDISPKHRNWHTGVFADRFRVQVADEPSTTVTSHISKDGHYYIHPNPLQCRSLTVREAARLQTFPDDYLFLGNRTQQYVQVGNAVPPYLAHQIAQLLYRVLEGPAPTKTSPQSKRRKA